jgi:hypothetical protein
LQLYINSPWGEISLHRLDKGVIVTPGFALRSFSPARSNPSNYVSVFHPLSFACRVFFERAKLVADNDKTVPTCESFSAANSDPTSGLVDF